MTSSDDMSAIDALDGQLRELRRLVAGARALCYTGRPRRPRGVARRMRYTVEVELPLTVEVLDVARGAEATRETPPEPDWVAVRVTLGALEVTNDLPPEVLANLEDDALARLRRAADEP